MGQNIKQIKGKIIFKHQTAAEWDLSNDGAGAQYVPDVGERVLYDPDETTPYTREKFGDGEHIVKDLPFANGQVDWNQNDESQPDYIKNKTHGSFKVINNIEFEESPITVGDFIRVSDLVIPFEQAPTIKYEFTSAYDYYPDTYPYLSNAVAINENAWHWGWFNMGGGWYTTVACFSAAGEYDLSNDEFYSGGWGPETVTITEPGLYYVPGYASNCKLSYEVEEVKKLDAKFLPDEVFEHPVQNGLGVESVQTESSNALGNYSTALGNNTIAGMKAYYYTGINPTTKKIYLSEISEMTSWENRALEPVYGDAVTDETYLISGFTAPAWNVGDWLGVINESHYIYQIQVAAVHDNVIEYTGELGFSSILKDRIIETVDITGSTKYYFDSDYQLFYFSNENFTNKNPANCIIKCNATLEDNSILEITINTEIYSSEFSPCLYTATDHTNGAIVTNLQLLSATQMIEGLDWDTDDDSYTVFNLDTPTEGAFSLKGSATAMGRDCKAVGSYSYATGYANNAYHFGHAEGYGNIAGYGAHAEGKFTKALGSRAHAEGNNNIASGSDSHVGGSSSEASGVVSFAHGWTTKALHEGAFVIGNNTKSSKSYQTVLGQFNADDASAAFIIGNGQEYKPRNAMTVSTEGQITLPSTGSLKIGNAQMTETELQKLLTTAPASYSKLTREACIEIPSNTPVAYMKLFPADIVADDERALLKFAPEYSTAKMGTIEDAIDEIKNIASCSCGIILNPLEFTYITVSEGNGGIGGIVKTSYADRIVYAIKQENNVPSLTMDTATNKYVGTVIMYYLKEA